MLQGGGLPHSPKSFHLGNLPHGRHYSSASITGDYSILYYLDSTVSGTVVCKSSIGNAV